jgi:hypothetical protein
MDIRRIFLSFLLLVLAQQGLGQESEQMQKIEKVYNNYVDLLPSSIKNKNYSTAFQNKLEGFSTLLGDYLKAGSGLSFEEMNEVRKMRSKINAMADFTWLGGAERNCGWGEKKNLSLIQEIYLMLQLIM